MATKDTATTKTRVRKELTIDEALKQFAPKKPAAPEKTEIEIAREQHAAQIEEEFRKIAEEIAEDINQTTDTGNLVGAITSISTAKSRLLKAVAALPDSFYEARIAETVTELPGDDGDLYTPDVDINTAVGLPADQA